MALSLNKLYENLLIRPSERKAVLFFTFVFFLIGCGLSLGRGSADALFLKRYGIEFLPLMFMVTGAVLALVFTIYAALVDLVSSNKLLSRVLYSASFVLLICWYLMRYTGAEQVYPAYYLLYELVSELLILHLSLYVAQNFSTQQVKRLLPLVFAGSQAGFIVGGLLLSGAAQLINIQDTLLLWLFVFTISSMLINRHHRKNGAAPYYRPGKRSKHKIRHAIHQLTEGLDYSKKSPLLRMMGFGFFFMVIAFYILTYSSNRIFVEYFQDESQLAAFYGILVAVNSSIALFMQVFISNKAIHHLGVQKVNLIFPTALCISFVGLLGAFILPLAIVAMFAKDVIMPVFRNPARNVFFTALPLHIQGRARAITVGLILPLALIVAGLMLFASQHIDSVEVFLVGGLLVCFAYLLTNVKINRAYIPTLVASLRQKVYVPDRGIFNDVHNDKNVLGTLQQGIKHRDEEIRFAACKTLIKVLGKESVAQVLPTIKGFSHPYQDRLIVLLFEYLNRDQIPLLRELSHNGDAHLEATIMRNLFRRFPSQARLDIEQALGSRNPRIIATGVYGVLINDIAELRENAHRTWFDLLYSDSPGEILSGIELVIRLNGVTHIERLFELTIHPNQRVQRQAAKAVSFMPLDSDKKVAAVVKRLTANKDHTIRQIGTHIAEQLDGATRFQLLLTLLGDPHPDVRRDTAVSLFNRDFVVRAIIDWIERNSLPPRAVDAIVSVLIQKEPSADEYKRIYRWLAGEAKRYIEMYDSVSTLANEGHSLLPILLAERCQEALLISLRVGSHVENEQLVETVIAGINTNSREIIENAMETLLEFNEKYIARQISDTVARLHNISDIVHSDQHWTLDKMKTHCQPESDPWLWGCIHSFTPRSDREYAYA